MIASSPLGHCLGSWSRKKESNLHPPPSQSGACSIRPLRDWLPHLDSNQDICVRSAALCPLSYAALADRAGFEPAQSVLETDVLATTLPTFTQWRDVPGARRSDERSALRPAGMCGPAAAPRRCGKSMAGGSGVEPLRLIAHPFSRRLPSPIGLASQIWRRIDESNVCAACATASR